MAVPHGPLSRGLWGLAACSQLEAGSDAIRSQLCEQPQISQRHLPPSYKNATILLTMSGFAPSLQNWQWAVSVAAQLAVCALLFFKGHFRRLPAFTVYVLLNLCQAGILFVAYRRFGFDSREANLFFIVTETITLVARLVATTEILRAVLGPYRGIWGLAWRLLAVTFVSVFSYAALQSLEDKTWAVMTADRGFHLAFAVALVTCLLLVRYYSIPIDSLYKTLLGGFCLYSCVHVLNDTLLQAIFFRYLHGFTHYQELWNAVTILPFIAALVTWAIALRNPAAEAHDQPVLLPASVYQRVSPEVNLGLRLLNERLSHFWRVETPRP